MPYRNKQMLRDANGDLIPQYWDVAAGDFKPLTGSDGANDTRLTGSNLEERILGIDIEVTPGATIPVGNTTLKDNIDEIAIVVRASPSESYRVIVYDIRPTLASAAMGGSLVSHDFKETEGVIKRFKPNFPKQSIRIRNQADVSMIFDVYIAIWGRV